MSTLALELDRLLSELDQESASALERTVRDALIAAKQRAAAGAGTDRLGYPVGYFESTSGSFADEPLDVAPESPMHPRESW
jgi:hypothetical protein